MLLLVLSSIAITVVSWLSFFAPELAKNYAISKVEINTVIVVSIDGFRAEYIDRGITPNLAKIADDGIMTESLIPVYPSITFPNHVSLVTGVYPSIHGIVNNEFYDPDLKEYFSYHSVNQSDPKWWLSEPIWTLAERQNVKSAVYLWPGSEVVHKGGVLPSKYIHPYNDSIPNIERIKTVLDWISLPAAESPKAVFLYFSEIDSIGHAHSPDSKSINESLVEIDKAIGLLADSIDFSRTNIVIVSDHGMATLFEEKTISLQKLVPVDLLEHYDGGAFVSLWPKNYTIVYSMLSRSQTIFPHFKIRTENELKKHPLYYTGSRRIAPIILECDPGWMIVPPKWETLRPWDGRGTHGYDPYHPDMAAIFIAKGPDIMKNSLSHRIPSKRAPRVHNLDIFPFLLKLLGIKGHDHNGTDFLSKLVLFKKNK